MYHKIAFFSAVLFLSWGCGIEDTLYFKEPTNISVTYDINNRPCVTFYGYNQEEDGGDYLFSGYDIYYYFSSASSAKRAMVKSPYPLQNTSDTTSTRNSNLIPSDVLKGSREIYSNISSSTFMSIYRSLSLPVTKKMIEDILYEGNSSDVKFYFYNKVDNDSDYSNPALKSGDEYVLFDNVYPNIDEYPDLDDDELDDFEGFLDKRYYEDLDDVTELSASTSSVKQYRCYFYLVAKGMDKTAGNSSLNNFVSSSKSSTFSVIFYVDQ